MTIIHSFVDILICQRENECIACDDDGGNDLDSYRHNDINGFDDDIIMKRNKEELKCRLHGVSTVLSRAVGVVGGRAATSPNENIHWQ